MYLGRMLLAGISCWTMLQTTSATESSIDLYLSQAVDTQCDGLPDAASMPAPGECILYTIDVRNIGNAAVYNVLVNANIPPHTQLERPLQLLATKTTELQSGEGAKATQIMVRELQPGEKTGLRLGYSVRVM